MPQDDQTQTCQVCRRREPTDGLVCGPCRLGLAAGLDRLLTRLAELPIHLAPSGSPPGERVTTSRTGSPAPARIDVLSLLAHGSQAREFTIDPATGEPVLATVDQAGIIPPREWLAQQVETWRHAFGHRRPSPRRPDPTEPAGERLGDAALAWLARFAPDRLTDAWAARFLLDAYRHGRAQLVTGMSPGHHGRRPTELREDDPLADEWALRFGEPAIAHAPENNVRYLKTWLDAACRRDDLDLRRFATELRTLNAELGRALGERVDAEYLGPCPNTVTDRITGVTGPCGATLRQDPYVSVVTCPRCRATSGPRVVDLIRLAKQIRRVWPLDRRRRYNFDDRSALPDVPCPACGQNVLVYWRDVTGSQDGWYTWFVPAGVMCPGGCAEALEVLR